MKHKKPSMNQLRKLQDRFLKLRTPCRFDRPLSSIKELPPLKAAPITSVYPEIRGQWLFELNEGYDPDDFNHGSNWLVWWFCPEGPDHVYMQAIGSHVKAVRDGTKFGGCLFCAGHYGSVTNSIEVFYPELAKEWDYKKNGGLTPSDFSYGSGLFAWWKCPSCKDSYEAIICNRTIRETGCFRCNVGEHTDLRDYPNAYKQFDRKLNKGVDPEKLLWHRKYWWRCKKAPDHVWQAEFCRIDSERCPFCRRILVSSTNNLGLRKDLVKQLHPTKNGKLDPSRISLASQKTLWWQCDKGPDHIWQAKVRTRLDGGGNCPYCINQWVSKTNSLKAMRPDLVNQWHPEKNKLTPAEVVASSTKKCWWKCDKGPDHEWQTTVVSRTRVNTGCPFCKNRKVSVTNSLANFPDIACEFDLKKNKPDTPDTVLAVTHKKYWWTCSSCKRQWKTKVYLRTQRGYSCRPCAIIRRTERQKSARQASDSKSQKK